MCSAARTGRPFGAFGMDCGGCSTVLAALMVWGAVDFDSLFILFHRLAFTNDLWLLNPETDLLIRLMPTDFFVHYAALIGGSWLAAVPGGGGG